MSTVVNRYANLFGDQNTVYCKVSSCSRTYIHIQIFFQTIHTHFSHTIFHSIISSTLISYQFSHLRSPYFSFPCDMSKWELLSHIYRFWLICTHVFCYHARLNQIFFYTVVNDWSVQVSTCVRAQKILILV